MIMKLHIYQTYRVEPIYFCKRRLKTKSHEPVAFWLCSVCSVGQQMCFIVRSSEGLVLSLGVMQVVLMVRVVKVVGLVTMVAVADDGVLNAFTLQVLLLVNTFQLYQQLLDESLGRRVARLLVWFLQVFHKYPSSLCVSTPRYIQKVLQHFISVIDSADLPTGEPQCCTGLTGCMNKNTQTQSLTVINLCSSQLCSQKCLTDVHVLQQG